MKRKPASPSSVTDEMSRIGGVCVSMLLYLVDLTAIAIQIQISSRICCWLESEDRNGYNLKLITGMFDILISFANLYAACIGTFGYVGPYAGRNCGGRHSPLGPEVRNTTPMSRADLHL